MANPLPNHSAFPVAVMRENQKKLTIVREAILWQTYRQQHPEFTDFARYLVLLESDRLNVVRLANIKELESRFPVVVQAAERKNREDFRTVLSREHALDWLVLHAYAHHSQLTSHFLHTLGTDKYRADKSQRARIRDAERYIEHTVVNIEERFEYGVIFFFNDEAQAQKLKDLLEEGEQLRQLMLAHLPGFTLDHEIVVCTKPKDHLKTIITVRVLESNEAISIHQFVLSAWVRYLEPSFDDDGEHPSYGRGFTISFPEVPGTDRQQVKIQCRRLAPLPELALQQTTQELHERVYRFGTQYGDFTLPSREGQSHLVERLRLVSACEVIEAQFLSPVGQDTDRNTFDTSKYSSQTLEIFIRGIYELLVGEQLSLEILPELYSLFFELGCRYEPLGLAMNNYLVDRLEAMEQPVEFVESLVEQTCQTPKLTRFNEQLNKIARELNGELVLIIDEIDELIHGTILPEFGCDFNTDRSPEITKRFTTEFVREKIYDVYIGMSSLDTEEHLKSAVIQITERLDRVIREKFPKYPLDKVQCMFATDRIALRIYAISPKENSTDETQSNE